MNIHILFGITGDLARKKVIPAIAHVVDRVKNQTGRDDIFCIGVGRKPEPPQEFKDLLQGGVYISGGLDQKNLYQNIASHIEKKVLQQVSIQKGGVLTLTVYSALPPDMHLGILQLVSKYVSAPLDKIISKKYKATMKVHMVIEKPLGTSYSNAKSLLESFTQFPAYTSFHFVDHYLAKEALINVLELSKNNPELFTPTFGSKDLKEIIVHLYETHGIEGRGAFYDPVGALFDVGQNHMLQVLARMVQLRIRASTVNLDAQHRKPVPNITTILNALSVQGKIIFGQYKGYTEVDQVKPGSKTETFFHVSFNIVGSLAKKHPELQGLKYTISSGKALPVKKAGVDLLFKKEKIHIDFNKGTRDAYEIMFMSLYHGDFSVFSDADSILSSWKIAERIKKLKTKSDLVVYNNTRDIIQ